MSAAIHMPASLVTDAPGAVHLSALELGALLALADTFWRSGVQPMPTNDAALSVLARCHMRRWVDIRSKVVPVWNAAIPSIAAVYAKTHAVRQAQAAGARKANATKRRKLSVSAPVITENMSDSFNSGNVPLVPVVAERSNRKAISGKAASAALSDAT